MELIFFMHGIESNPMLVRREARLPHIVFFGGGQDTRLPLRMGSSRYWQQMNDCSPRDTGTNDPQDPLSVGRPIPAAVIRRGWRSQRLFVTTTRRENHDC